MNLGRRSFLHLISGAAMTATSLRASRAANEPLRIGSILSVTGPAAFLGEDNLENISSGSQLGHQFIFDLTRRLGGVLSVESEENKEIGRAHV